MQIANADAPDHTPTSPPPHAPPRFNRDQAVLPAAYTNGIRTSALPPHLEAVRQSHGLTDHEYDEYWRLAAGSRLQGAFKIRGAETRARRTLRELDERAGRDEWRHGMLIREARREDGREGGQRGVVGGFVDEDEDARTDEHGRVDESSRNDAAAVKRPTRFAPETGFLFRNKGVFRPALAFQEPPAESPETSPAAKETQLEDAPIGHGEAEVSALMAILASEPPSAPSNARRTQWQRERDDEWLESQLKKQAKLENRRETDTLDALDANGSTRSRNLRRRQALRRANDVQKEQRRKIAALEAKVKMYERQLREKQAESMARDVFGEKISALKAGHADAPALIRKHSARESSGVEEFGAAMEGKKQDAKRFGAEQMDGIRTRDSERRTAVVHKQVHEMRISFRGDETQIDEAPVGKQVAQESGGLEQLETAIEGTKQVAKDFGADERRTRDVERRTAVVDRAAHEFRISFRRDETQLEEAPTGKHAGEESGGIEAAVQGSTRAAKKVGTNEMDEGRTWDGNGSLLQTAVLNREVPIEKHVTQESGGSEQLEAAVEGSKQAAKKLGQADERRTRDGEGSLLRTAALIREAYHDRTRLQKEEEQQARIRKAENKLSKKKRREERARKTRPDKESVELGDILDISIARTASSTKGQKTESTRPGRFASSIASAEHDRVPGNDDQSSTTPRASDELHLQVPASGRIFIDDELSIDLNASTLSLQQSLLSMQRRLKMSYPRVDTLPFDMSSSENRKTLQTWLKILTTRWRARNDGAEHVETEEGFVKELLDQMVRDYDLSNESAERMARKWIDLSQAREEQERRMDEEDWNAGGLGFLREDDVEHVEDAWRAETTPIQQLPRTTHPAMRRMYSTSSSRDQHLPHLTPSGAAHMVCVAAKPHTHRTAIAIGTVSFSNPSPLPLIRSAALKKGDVLSVSRVAGIMAAKKCPDIVPLCHPIALSSVEVELRLLDRGEGLPFGGVGIQVKVGCMGPTGVEMEALTGVVGAALSVVDMCKGVDRGVGVGGVRVVMKEGGRRGGWREEGWEGWEDGEKGV